MLWSLQLCFSFAIYPIGPHIENKHSCKKKAPVMRKMPLQIFGLLKCKRRLQDNIILWKQSAMVSVGTSMIAAAVLAALHQRCSHMWP